METVIYLIRHSEKINPNLIDNTNNNEHYQLKREKIVLSVNGEKKAQRLSEIDEFDNLDIIFSSNYTRAIQTATYFAEKQQLVIHIDERLNERKLGIRIDNQDLYLKQYYDEDLKNQEGECRKEVTNRMYDAFWEIVNNNIGKRIAIFTHGAAITFLLMKWCKLENINTDKKKRLSFNGNIVCDKIFAAPEVFKIKVNKDNQITSIENLIFDT